MKKWDKLLDTTVTAINLLPSRALMGISPAEENDSVYNDDLRKRREQYQMEEEKYLPKPTKKKELPLFSYVYADPAAKESFFKGYNFTRGMLLKIYKKDKRPGKRTLYYLEQLDGTKVPRLFYREQLREGGDPADIRFPIEKIVSTWKLKNGKKMAKAS